MGHCEIDLHGLTWKESLARFIEAYNGAFDCTGKPSGVQVRVIHGYGSTGEGGVLRKRIRSFCQRFEDHLEVTAGEEIDGNRGCTVVNPIRRLPDMHEMLAEQIRVYCKRPRSRSKVLGRFRRHGQPNIMLAVRLLEKQGCLRRRASTREDWQCTKPVSLGTALSWTCHPDTG